MSKVLVTRALPAGSLDPLIEAGHQVVQRPGDIPLQKDELLAEVADVDAVICLLTDSIDRSVVEAASGRVRVFATAAVGYDNFDLAAVRDHGIILCNTPGVLDDATADLTFLLILAASRLATDAESDLRAGRWQGWNINHYLGRELSGSTLGVVGWGRIGQAVARRAQGFNMEVLHHARKPTGVPGYVERIDDLMPRVDTLTLHVPLNDDSRNLIDARRIRLMKATAVLINTARGPLVDEEALAGALHRHELFAAGLDVFNGEPAISPKLLSAPRTVLLPHIGSATVQARRAMGRMAAESVVAVLAGREPPHQVPL